MGILIGEYCGAKGLEIISGWSVLESQTQGRVSPPPGATLMEYIFRLMEHSAENQFSFGDAQSTTKSTREVKSEGHRSSRDVFWGSSNEIFDQIQNRTHHGPQYGTPTLSATGCPQESEFLEIECVPFTGRPRPSSSLSAAV